MQFNTSPSPFLYQSKSVSGIMRQVLYAMVPGFTLYVYYLGWGIVINLLIASVTAIVAEAVILWLRQRPLRPVLTDGSALVTAWLLVSALSPIVPWWITVLGSSFAIIFVKQLYGGLGHNPFNPAVAGYAMLLISFPAEMSRWPTLASMSGYHPGLLDSMNMIFHGQTLAGLPLDAITSATPLDTMKTALKQFYTVTEIKINPLFGYFGAKEVEWIIGGFFLGGLWLLYQRVITWHIPVAILGTLLMISGMFFLIDPSTHPSPLFHIFSGGAVVGAFFIATDPVTAATSNQGRLIYGLGIGILVFVIRTWGGYPDGIAFAVLLMNLAAPTIDYYTQPRVFGQAK